MQVQLWRRVLFEEGWAVFLRADARLECKVIMSVALANPAVVSEPELLVVLIPFIYARASFEVWVYAGQHLVA